jgi:cytochrome c oxidase assembly protein subunit 15
VVTAHLLGGMVLLALLAAQLQALRLATSALPVRGAVGVLFLLAVQIALGGWVSSNYAVLACRGFPDCNGQWWPQADFAQGFTLLRELGRAGVQSYVAFDALVAIHLTHRIFALVLTVALLMLAAKLWRVQRGSAVMLLALLTLQIGSGLSNVLLDWPLLAALLHTAGAAALVVLLTSLACRTGGREFSARTAVAAAGTWLHRGA